ncbi:class I adenylate-forming enzyme family protein [Pseudonocardia thermophila]|uniref:class I adenylate-forming enzyme family protein n=1 Tax=Pseudonocardia thermophila TaxID=1848 RepID=UPI00248F20C0|nr:class I adenylate-forming enzyme family protein [Pseudonocardia thermophila]
MRVPVELDYEPTLPCLLLRAAEQFKDREFLVDGDRSWTFADVEEESAQVALGLLALGVGKGSRVAVLMPNGPSWVVSWLAAARIGALTVPLSTFYQARELSWALRHNDIDTLLVSARYLKHDYVARLEEALPGLRESTSTTLHLHSHPYLRRIVVWDGCDRAWGMSGPDDVVRSASGIRELDRAFLAEVERNVAPADDLVTICTSGSSAQPKAVVHMHGTVVRTTAAFLDYIDVRPDDRTYCGQPFFWVGGLNVNLLAAMHLGMALVFSPSPDPETVLGVIESARVTRLSMWPAQVRALREHASSSGRDLSSVRVGFHPRRDEQGNVIPPERLISSGAGSGLGMTETFGMHSIEKVANVLPRGKENSWGRHLPSVERRIVDPETGRELPPGELGELYVRGSTMMRGYYKIEPHETFTRDGFFATGDLCTIDEDDHLYFHGRRTELVKVAGANVAPREVELVAESYEQVQEAVVFGLPDEVKGEIVVCVVVPAAAHEVDPNGLRARLRQDLSAYKVPEVVITMGFDEIPRTASAKPPKPKLREIVSAQLGRPATRP